MDTAVIVLVILLIAALCYIFYIKYYDKIYKPINNKEKKVRFSTYNDSMSFLDPDYEEKRIEEMQYDMM